MDSRQWELFGSLFLERVFVDFPSFGLSREMSRDELLEITRGIAGFDATQHLSTNHRHTIEGDRATCVSYMHAGHFLKHEGQDHACFLYGFYTYKLLRTAAGWKVDHYGLQVTAQHGEPRVFEWSGMR